jgi:hypothetical protein
MPTKKKVMKKQRRRKKRSKEKVRHCIRDRRLNYREATTIQTVGTTDLLPNEQKAMERKEKQ